jgi:CHAT domain-containing protein
LNNSLKQALAIQDKRAETYVLGYLGKLKAQQGQLDKAIALTNQALILAQEQNINGDAREISYLWQSQLGQLLEKQGKHQDAIAAYTEAVNILQSLRTDLNANNQVVQFDFRQEVQPVYLQLADLLLQSDSNELKSLTSIKFTDNQPQSEIQSDNNLELARKVIESLQLAELDNFFQDPCSEVTDLAIAIDNLDSQAAIIYPIVLADRLEVIYSLPGKPLKRFKIAIAQSEVNKTLDQLYDTLYNRSVDNSAVNIFSTIPLNPAEFKENTQKLLPILQQVHSWLIKPLEKELDLNQIKTLVFVPNGRLQSLPMSALYDGQQYLLEKYSIALAPSLQLIDSRPIKRQKLKVLAAGVSEQVEIQGQIFPALGNVPQELDQIKIAFPASQKLLNQEFTTASIQSQLQSDFPVIHLATHGLFSSDPQKTFIITGDRNIINVDQLTSLLGSGNVLKPELIVLSACETATGDERAMLGLAGVAIRSGTRSTLATLWSVGDASTAKLMGQFYRELENPEISKVHALQNAQLSLIQSLRSNPLSPELNQLPPHPYYWASYVLVGNWR